MVDGECKTKIIAEVGVNHNGNFELAKKLIDIAANVGADAVKFQTFNSEKLAHKNVRSASYQIKNTGKNINQFKMLSDLELSQSDHVLLLKHCQSLGLEFISSPFDMQSANFLINLGLKTIKIGSGELNNLEMLWHLAKFDTSLILSTGMATLGDIELALATISHGMYRDDPPTGIDEMRWFWATHRQQVDLSGKVALLHCTTSYPTDYNDVNLNAIRTLRNSFGLKVGYSDHTIDNNACVAAVALGARIIEKHITIDRNFIGPDHLVSSDPEEFAKLVKNIRAVEQLMGDGLKLPCTKEYENSGIVKKRILAHAKITKGERFTEENICLMRANVGLDGLYFWDVVGTKATKNYEVQEPIEILGVRYD